MNLDPAWVINHTCREIMIINKLYYYIKRRKENTLKIFTTTSPHGIEAKFTKHNSQTVTSW